MHEEFLEWCEARMETGRRIEAHTVRQLIRAIRELQAPVEAPLPSIVGALEAKRKGMGLTKMAFAAELGIQRSHYTEIVQGKRALSPSAGRKAFKLGVSAKVLLQEQTQVLEESKP